MAASSAAASASCVRGSAAAGTAGGDGAGGLRCRDTHPPRLTLLEPLHGGNPEHLGPTKGRTITLLAQLLGKRVNGLNLFREHPYLYWQFHCTDKSS